MSDCVEYSSLMDYLKATSDFSSDTRTMLNNLIYVMIQKEMLDYNEVDFIRMRGFYDNDNNNARS